MIKNSTTGFTFTELLAVMTLIAFLGVAATLIFFQIRQRARDTVRLNNISVMREALEQYRLTEGNFPAMLEPGALLQGSSGIVYLRSVPSNPRPRNEGNCPDNDYLYLSTGLTYIIHYCLAGNLEKISAGSKIATEKYLAVESP